MMGCTTGGGAASDISCRRHNDVAYLTVDDVSQVEAIIDMARGRNTRVVSAVLVAHLVDAHPESRR